MRFFLLAAFLAVCLASQSYRCNFQARSTAMTNGGYVNGVMKYDFNNKQMLFSYSTSGSQQLYRFNSAGGYATTTTKYDGQYEFSWGGACPCSSSALKEPMPALFVSTTYLKSAGGTTYNPLSADSAMTSVTFDDAGYPTKYVRKDGQVFSFSGCTDATFSASSDFTTPSECSCGKPINVVLVLDRSSSIDAQEFSLEKQFTKNLVAGFTYSATGVNLGITNFHTVTWDGPVNLAQGNNEASVTAGASALQCAPDAQCVVFSSPGTCCGMGTSISSGIINGADMLKASVTTTGFRASAANVMIVLTDGYHNKVLKRSGDTITRDASGKPYGTPVVISGTTCSEGGEAVCKQALLDDLVYSVKYAVDNVPRLQMISVGVGPVVSSQQLLAIANGIQSNVFSTNDFNALLGIVDDLVSTTCSGGAITPCTGCCGFCSCSGCTSVDGCDNGNFCDVVSKSGNCCNAVAKPPSSCDEPNKCNTYSCDRTAKNGAGGCVSAPKPLTPTTNCSKYECNPVNGETNFTDLCPPQPACRVDTDCDDKKKCTVDKCVIPVPTDPMSAFCETKSVTCTGTKCYTSACDEATGSCVKTPNPIPAATTCTTYSCDDQVGIVPTNTGLCTTTPLCTVANQTRDCNDGNFCNDDTCVLAVPTEPRTAKCVYTPKPTNFCVNNDKCQSVACVPDKGCVFTPIGVPPDTTCTSYSCDMSKGIVLTPTGLCTPTPVCTVATQSGDCNDNNACTDDTCVLAVPSEPRTAKCVNTPKAASFCASADKCVTTSCDPAKGCVSTPVLVPADTTCLDYSCDSTKGIVSASTDLCTTTPLCTVANQTRDCNDGNFCNDDTCVLAVPTEPRTAKCVYTPKPTNFCDSPDKCVSTACVPDKGCVSTPIPIPATTPCTSYTCTPTEGIVASATGRCTDTPVCTVATQSADCDDQNACTDDTCVLAVPTEPKTAKCVFTPKPSNHCDKADKCFTYSCSPATGCVDTPVPVPADTTCTDFECTPAEGIVSQQTGACSETIICTVATQTADCDDGDACTDDICVLAVPSESKTAKCVFTPKAADACTEDDKCFTYSCDPATGCVKTAVPVPPNTVCSTFTCDPATGIVESDTGACTSTVVCTPPNEAVDCNDGNACTDDLCVLADPSEPRTAKCVSSDKPADHCQKDDKCFTYSCSPTEGCVDTPVPVPANTTCLNYECLPDEGIVSEQTGACSQTIVCTVETEGVDCHDGNACTDDACVLTVPTEPLTAKCVFTEKPANHCDGEDKCQTYKCDPIQGCVSEPVPVPSNTLCTKYECDPVTGTINTTDLCPPKPQCLVAGDCDDKNACTVDSCVLKDPEDPLSAKCVWVPIPASQCDDQNACTYDSCNVETGCVNEPVPEDLCNDNDACTIDSCNPLSQDLVNPCLHVAVVCNVTEDVCKNTTCHTEKGCITLDVVCPTTDNCTLSGCNSTDNKGCYVTSAGTCGFPVGLVAGLAAGVVAGIVIAAVAGAALFAGGAAYAFTQGSGAGLGAAVSNNPLYQNSGESGTNPLHRG